ncbi:MAG: Panacea domain-containing protein [Actinoallomurus sp.]
MFPERFQAWANGPVSPDLYKCHRGRFQLNDGDIPGDPNLLDEGERESIDLVLQGLGDYTAHQLSTMTHREAPWVQARARAGAQPLQRRGAGPPGGDRPVGHDEDPSVTVHRHGAPVRLPG